MKILLDTHVLLWLWLDNPRLSERAKSLYLDPVHQLFFSTASLWEIGIKYSLGKITLKADWFPLFISQLKKNSIQWLPISPQHCHQVSLLPFHHRDPFDRMLIAQAFVEEFQVLTSDANIKKYDVKCLWE